MRIFKVTYLVPVGLISGRLCSGIGRLGRDEGPRNQILDWASLASSPSCSCSYSSSSSPEACAEGTSSSSDVGGLGSGDGVLALPFRRPLCLCLYSCSCSSSSSPLPRGLPRCLPEPEPELESLPTAAILSQIAASFLVAPTIAQLPANKKSKPISTDKQNILRKI